MRGTLRLEHLVGHRLLVGITVCDGEGTPLHRDQFCGRVLEVADGVVAVERADGGAPALLPADPDAYAPAGAGTYVLVGSGERVVDPDFVTTWEVRRQHPPGQPVPGPAPAANPAPPSATATTSNVSISTGGDPMS